MKTKANMLALFGEGLTIPACLWVFAATLFMKDASEPLPGMIWTLLMAGITVLIYRLFLQKPRSIPALAVVSTLLVIGQALAYVRLYDGEIFFGFILTVLLLPAVTSYAALYYCLREPTVGKHLFFLDVMILALIWLFLFVSVLRVSVFSQICAVLVVLLDIGGLIALRMSEDGDSEGIGGAFLLAAGSAAVLGGVIFLLVKVFSRSGKVTGAFLGGIQQGLIVLWGWINAFIEWLASHFKEPEFDVSPDPTPMMSQEMEDTVLSETSVDPTLVLLVIVSVIAVAAILLVIRFRKNKASISFGQAGGRSTAAGRRRVRSGGWFAKLAERLAFLKNYVLYRNTPRGVLVWLERRAKRKKASREKGESIREFVTRLTQNGELTILADELEAMLYGGRPQTLSADTCRKIKKNYKKCVKINTSTQ